jgi:hypothetical protein
MTLKSDSMASTVSHAENCLYDILQEIKERGSLEQKETLYNALEELETLYFSLRNED